MDLAASLREEGHMSRVIERRSWVLMSLTLSMMLAIAAHAQARDGSGLVGSGVPGVHAGATYVQPYFFGGGGFGPYGYFGGSL